MNLKEKEEFNFKLLNELKTKFEKEKENLEEMKKNASELKIDIHNKKMKQKSKVECDPIIKINQKVRQPSMDQKNSIGSNNGQRKITFQSEDFNKNCDCNCIIC